jgi:hypothetical protein
MQYLQVTVAARSKAWTVFSRSVAGIVGLNPTQGMDVWCLYAFILYLCCPVLGSGLATSSSLVQGVVLSVKNDYGTEKEARALNGLEKPLKKMQHLIRL